MLNMFVVHMVRSARHDFAIRLCPPMSVENLLGVPLEYIMYDSTTVNSAKMEIRKGTLQRGEKLFAYEANLKNSILLKIIPPGGIWQTNKMALLHSNEKPTRPLTRQLSMHDNNNNPLNILFEYKYVSM